METSSERRIFKAAFVALLTCLSFQVWWLFREPPAIAEKENVEREMASVSHGVLNIFVDTDEVTDFLSRLPIISNLGGGR